MTTVLVSCVSQKQDGCHPASELYQGQFWDAQKAYAQTHGDEWYILSAKHELVHPDTPLCDYEMTMDDRNESEWASAVFSQMHNHDLAGEEIIITAGRDYSNPLMPLLGEHIAQSVFIPFDGVKLADQTKAMQLEVKKRRNHSLC